MTHFDGDNENCNVKQNTQAIEKDSLICNDLVKLYLTRDE